MQGDFAVVKDKSSPYRKEYFENKGNALAAARARSKAEGGRWHVIEWVGATADWWTIVTFEGGKEVVV